MDTLLPTPDGMRVRLAGLLHFWGTDILRSPVRETTPTLDESEAVVWREVLETAEVIPPRTHGDGLDRLLSLHTDSGALDVDLETLREKELLVSRGSRMSLRGRRFHEAYPDLRIGFDWGLAIAVGPNQEHLPQLRSIANKYSASLCELGDFAYFTEPRCRRRAIDLGILGSLASKARGYEDALDVWKRASVLKLESMYVATISDEQRRLLATGLLSELSTAGDTLDVQSDIYLDTFREAGHRLKQAKEKRDAYPRVLRLAEAAHQLAYSHESIATDYFVACAESFAQCASGTALAKGLGSLPPGRALLRALSVIINVRPHVLVEFVRPDACAEAAFLVLLLPARQPRRRGAVILRDEQAKVLELFWILALRVCESDDLTELLAASILQRSSLRGSPIQLARHHLTADFHAWADCLREDRHQAPIVEALVGLFGVLAAPNRGALVFALELISDALLDDAQQDQLATAIVAHYRAGAPKTVPDLSQHGRWLGELAAVLHRSSKKGWGRWRTPRQLASVLKVADDHDAGWRVGEFLDSHLGNLTAQLLHVRDDLFSDVAETILKTYERARGAPGLFEWPRSSRAPHRHERHPWLAVFGKAIADRGSAGKRFTKRFLETELSAVELLHFRSGLGEACAYASAVDDAIEQQLTEAESSGLSIGALCRIAEALFSCGRYVDADAKALEALHCLENIRLDEQRFSMSWIRKQCALTSGRLEDVLGIRSDAGTTEHSDALANLDAIALLELKRADEALAVLTSILKRTHDDVMAASNRIGALVSLEDWETARAAVDEASAALGDNLPDAVHQNAAIIEWELGNYPESLRYLSDLSPTAQLHPDMVKLRAQMVGTHGPVRKALERDISTLAQADPGSATMAQTLLGRSYVPPNPVFVGGQSSSFAERCTPNGIDPEDMLLGEFRNGLSTLSTQPALAAKLSEDEITLLLMLLLRPALGLAGLHVDVKAAAGWGRKRQGEADLYVTESGSMGYVSTLVRCEAKIWRAQSWFEEGMREILGQSSGRTELFLGLLVYYRDHEYLEWRDTVATFIEQFSVDHSGKRRFRVAEPVEVMDMLESPVLRVLRARHRLRSDSTVDTVTVYYMLADVGASSAHAARTNELVRS